jgi:type II secretory pathway pseudopilin PulG
MNKTIKQKGFTHQNFLKKISGGFTLIELIVATSIFIVILVMALGSLLSSSAQSKKSEALRGAMDNVNFAAENMSRNLRVGTDYNCITTSVSLPSGTTADCNLSTSGGGAIAFTPANHSATPGDTAYQRSIRSDGTYTLQRCTTSGGCVDIVGPEVNVELLKFFVSGSNAADVISPSVYIIMKGTVTVKQIPTAFTIQTLAAQRSTE